MSREKGRGRRKRKQIYSLDEKTQVIARLLSSGCTVTEVARSTGINRTTLYEWKRGAMLRSRPQAQQQGLTSDGSDLSLALPANFVEVAIADSSKTDNLENQSSGLNLDKEDNSEVTDDDRLNLSEVSLIFEDFSLNIKGRFSASRLIEMLDLLVRQ